RHRAGGHGGGREDRRERRRDGRRYRARSAGRGRPGRRARRRRRRRRGPRRGQGREQGREDRGERGQVSTPTITAAQVKELRDRTGAGMMDCKKVLSETDGDIDAAVELLRVRLGDKALKMGGRETTEGTVQAYIHTNGKTGVLVEVDCNTDFVARNEDFIAFARDVALHVAASPEVRWVSEEEIPEE